jgi:hypothetical protein
MERLSPNSETGLHEMKLKKGSTRIKVCLESAVRTESRENNTVSVYKGPVLFALEVKHSRTSTPPKPYWNPDFGQEYYNKSYFPAQSHDWSYHNTSKWNYAIDPQSLQYHSSKTTSTSLANPLFRSGGPPNHITAKACEIEWPMAFDGSVPGYPPVGDARKCIGDVVEVKLVPYGSARTRMAELPVIDLSDTA